MANKRKCKYCGEYVKEFITTPIASFCNYDHASKYAYANKHKGFSITYNRKSINQIAMGPYRIDYIKKLKKVKFDRKNINAIILFLSSVKSHYWSYEKEWRFLGVGKDLMYFPYRDYGLEKERKQQNRKLYLPKKSVTEVRLGFYFFDYENISKNNLNESVVNLNNEKDKEFKIKLLTHVKANKIPLSLVHLNKDEFKFQPVSLDYDFIKESNTFKWRLPSH